MSKIAYEFICSRALCEKWGRVIDALGGTIDQGGKPQVDTSEWTTEDWEIWSFGGCFAVDEETFGAVSFYRIESNEVSAFAYGSDRLLHVFKAGGAYAFSHPKLVGDGKTSRLIDVSLQQALAWPEWLDGSIVHVHSSWPSTERSLYRFPVGSVSDMGARFDIRSGLWINPTNDEFRGYIFVKVLSRF